MVLHATDTPVALIDPNVEYLPAELHGTSAVVAVVPFDEATESSENMTRHRAAIDDHNRRVLEGRGYDDLVDPDDIRRRAAEFD